MRKLIFFLYFTQLNSIVNCLKIIPVKSEFITKFKVNGSYRNPNETYEVVFDLYIKEGDSPDELLAIIRNEESAGLPSIDSTSTALNLFKLFVNRRFFITWTNSGEVRLGLPGESMVSPMYFALYDYLSFLNFDIDILKKIENGVAIPEQSEQNNKCGKFVTIDKSDDENYEIFEVERVIDCTASTDFLNSKFNSEMHTLLLKTD